MKRNKIFAVVLVVVMTVICLFGMTAVAGETENPEVKYTYNTPFPNVHPFSILDQAWFDELAQYNIIVEPFWSNSLVSPVTPYQEVLDGVADMTQVIPGAEADHFYVANAVQAFYAWGTSTPRVVYEVTKALVNECEPLRAEYKGVVPFGICNAGEPAYFITKEPVRTLSDLKGMSIRVANDADFELIKHFGGEPIRLEVPALMESLEKGVIDGVLLSAEALVSMNFAEICKYATATDHVATFSVQKFISEDSYNKMTDEQKAAFDELAVEADIKRIDAGVDSEAAGLAFGEENGVEFITLSDEDLAEIDQVYSDYALQVVEELNAKGFDGQGIYDATRAYMEQFEAEYGR